MRGVIHPTITGIEKDREKNMADRVKAAIWCHYGI
jgi:hypothetical protein